MKCSRYGDNDRRHRVNETDPVFPCARMNRKRAWISLGIKCVPRAGDEPAAAELLYVVRPCSRVCGDEPLWATEDLAYVFPVCAGMNRKCIWKGVYPRVPRV